MVFSTRTLFKMMSAVASAVAFCSASSHPGEVCADKVQTFEVKPLGPVLGAEVTGLDLSLPMSDSLFKQVDELISEYLVVCFRGQQAMTPETQINFTRNWGAVEPHPLGSRADSHPVDIPLEVMVAQNTMKAKGNKSGTVRNDIWHSDLSCMTEPVGLSVLRALEVPPPGWGDTMFANMRNAWETLAPDLRLRVARMDAVHNTAHFEGKDRKEVFLKTASNIHPVVRTHPKTNRNALYLSGNFIHHFDGMTREESMPLLKQLIAHATIPENVYRHRWHAGDLVVWDNRATMHYAVFDYEAGQARELHRTTSAGERPFRVLEESFT